jgi:hypothetical protein
VKSKDVTITAGKFMSMELRGSSNRNGKSIIVRYTNMNTIALQGSGAKPEAKAHKRGKAKVAASSSKLTEKLQQLLDDVENNRYETVDPKNYREGFKELIEKRKRS